MTIQRDTLRSKAIRLAHKEPSLRAVLLPLLKEARGRTVLVRDLPASIQKVLREVRYGSRDITVEGRTSYQMAGASGAGEKAFTAAVNLETGQYKIEWGSWGGPNMFNPKNPVDLDTKPRPIRKNMAVVQGHIGNRTWAYIEVHPDNIQNLLPNPEEEVELTDKEKDALRLMPYKTFYKKEEFERRHLGQYGPSNPLLQSLAKKGLIKIMGGGAMTLTLNGKNVLGTIGRGSIY